MRKELLDSDDIFVIHDFLSREECDDFISRSEAIGYGDAPINAGLAGQVIRKDVRNNDRVMSDDVALAQRLWERVEPFVPTPRQIGHSRWDAIGLNERFRYYRYTSGQRFDWHFDGRFSRENGECSDITFMVYLSDDFEGGSTEFNMKTYGGIRLDDPILAVKPVAGMALLFRHNVLHTGAVVTSGVKYAMRTDVMFRINRE